MIRLAGLLACALACPAAASGQSPPRLELVEVDSRVFGNRRLLRVLLPAGYDDARNASRRYPVLYLNDGQNLFDAATSLFNPVEWRVDETVADLVARGRVPPLIVVGIDNAGRALRFHEYFPWVDEFLQPRDSNPQGRRYPEFLIGEVMPLIASRFRARAGPEHRGLGGSSAGALAALYTVVTRPGIFGRLLIESPSLYVDDYRILREAELVQSWPERIYLGVGTNESNAAECPPRPPEGALELDVQRLHQLLRSRRVAPHRIRLAIEPCGRHDEDAWARRFPGALAFLFGAR